MPPHIPPAPVVEHPRGSSDVDAGDEPDQTVRTIPPRLEGQAHLVAGDPDIVIYVKDAVLVRQAFKGNEAVVETGCTMPHESHLYQREST